MISENPDWNRCIDENSLKLGRCIYACENNQECEDDCLSRFKTRQLDCPCEVFIIWLRILEFLPIALYLLTCHINFNLKENCSVGCPCSDFDCIVTTTAPDVATTTGHVTTTAETPNQNAVLVLSTRNGANRPFIVDFNGE